MNNIADYKNQSSPAFFALKAAHCLRKSIELISYMKNGEKACKNKKKEITKKCGCER
jgi:hypothetical protein